MAISGWNGVDGGDSSFRLVPVELMTVDDGDKESVTTGRPAAPRRSLKLAENGRPTLRGASSTVKQLDKSR